MHYKYCIALYCIALQAIIFIADYTHLDEQMQILPYTSPDSKTIS